VSVSRAGRRLRCQRRREGDRPAHVHLSSARPVDQRRRCVDDGDLERLVPAAVVGITSPTTRLCHVTSRRRAARRRRGTKRSTDLGRYHPARCFPSWMTQGHTASGGASSVKARSMTTSAFVTMSSPGRGAVTSCGRGLTEAKALVTSSSSASGGMTRVRTPLVGNRIDGTPGGIGHHRVRVHVVGEGEELAECALAQGPGRR